MKPINQTNAAETADARQTWVQPSVRQLAASTAELGPNPNADFEGGS